MPQGSILGTLLFLLYINNLHTIINNDSVPILFVDDTSISVTNSNPIDFNINIYNIFAISNTRLRGTLTFSKFQENTICSIYKKKNVLNSRKIRYGNTTIPNVSHTKLF